MAVSLVSTGIQFPDSTIQTTAASGAPSMATNGSTIITQSSPYVLWTYGSNAGTYFGTTNISTTPLSVIWQSPEIRANMWWNPGGGSPAMYSSSGYGWSGTGEYSVCWYRLQYDHYANRFVATLYIQGGALSQMNWYSEDGGNTWFQFQNSNVQLTSGIQVPAFNTYTGAKVTTQASYQGMQVRTFTAANAYDMDASAANSQSFGYEAGPVSFIDTGTQSTSKFFIPIPDNATGQLNIYTRTADQDSSAGAWVGTYAGNKSQCSRIIGTAAELMCYAYNGGVVRSTSMGAAWSNYNFGSNTYGTSSTYYWKHMAWNGSYWLGTLYNNSYRLVTKAMDSSTSWTELTNLSTPGITEWTGVAWNPTLALWIIIKKGVVYTNTSSDPNAGTWTVARYLPFFGTNSSQITFTPIYVKAASTYNY